MYICINNVLIASMTPDTYINPYLCMYVNIIVIKKSIIISDNNISIKPEVIYRIFYV